MTAPDRVPRLAQSAGLHALSSAAVFVALASIILALNGGPEEKLETGLWAIAILVALPLGVLLGERQSRRLTTQPEPAARWALALGALLLMAALLLLRSRGSDGTQLVISASIALTAAAMTELVSRRPSILRGLRALPNAVPVAIGTGAVAIMLFLFRRGSFANAGAFIASLALTLVGLVAVLVLDRWAPRVRLRRLVDFGLCAILAMIVFQVEVRPDAWGLDWALAHHHNFFLSPVHNMAHGRPMLVEVWAQYGVGSYYALLAALSVLPRHYGGFVLLQSTLMAALYVLVYVTLRLAVRSQPLVVAATSVAVLSNIFAPFGQYVWYPSAGPIRFCVPYLIVAAAVVAARWPGLRRTMRVAQFAVVAIAAVWSFETFVYTTVTWVAVAAVASLGASRTSAPKRLRVFWRDAALAAGVSVLAWLGLTMATRVASGRWPQWDGYLQYLRVYSLDEFGTIPFDFWSPASLMAAAILFSAVGVVWATRNMRTELPAALLAGLAGFTGLAVSSFTYYVGRSHPNNLLYLIVPVCALGGLWAGVLLARRPRGHVAWRVPALGFLLWTGSTLAVYAWPLAVQEWQLTAFAQAVPYADGNPPSQSRSVRKSLQTLWEGPVSDGRAVSGASLLQRHIPGNGPVLVLAEPDVTCEILLRADRANLLPVSQIDQDSLVVSRMWPRVAAAIDHIPNGEILLKPTRELHAQYDSKILVLALEELRRRFDFHVLENSPDGLQVVRLESRDLGPNHREHPGQTTRSPSSKVE